VLNEPVRGAAADPSIYSLTGLEHLRTYLQGRVSPTPHSHLLGYRLTQASSGSVAFNQPISPWFDVYDGFVDLAATAEVSIYAAAQTAAPAGFFVRTANMSLRYLRPCTVENESVIARGRVLHAGSNVTTVETLIEDSLGRAVAHATGSSVLEKMDPAPPPVVRPFEPVDQPTYSTPDPPRRPVPFESIQAPESPLSRFLGAEFVGQTPGRTVVTMPTSVWFCNAYREVAPGILGALASVVSRGITTQLAGETERFVTLNLTYSFPGPVEPDGRPVEAVATLRGRRGDMAIVDVEISDADGRLVLACQATGLVREKTARPGERAPERLLLTVLFTDVVDSTQQAVQLGDARWGELREEHHALVRRALDVHKGREVKTTGDGFLATFDSPTRAARCARDIRDGVERLGLMITAGIHTGECDLVGGDIGGVAVHAASRIESEARPGEILVSSTVRDLVSGISLSDRGPRPLKGLDGDWTLFAVE
jgi:uncharacterized protein (TIGR00369 family)